MAVPPVSAAIWLGGVGVFRNGPASLGTDGAAVAWLLLGVAGIAISTQAVITIARRSELDDRTWRIGGLMATVVTAAMLVATGATITWGLIANANPIVLNQLGSPQLVYPGDRGQWLVVTVIMAVTTARAVIALIGSRRTRPASGEKPAVA
jgi:hypothetical protein